MLFFIGAMLPMIILAVMFAADLTRIIDSQRQASYVAENAAVAGSLQYAGQTDRLDPAAARRAARDTANVSFSSFVMRHAADQRVERVTLGRSGGADTVAVTVSYRIESLIVARFFLGDENGRLAVTRTAQVCAAGSGAADATTGGFCSRPRARQG